MNILRASMLVVTLLLSSGCAIYHHYGEYYGKVIDAETKEPLEGAVVLAEYNTAIPTLAGTNTKYLDAQETLTDKNGEFKIPSNTVFTFRPFQYVESPVWFTIFKPGYGYFPRHDRSRINSERPRNGVLPPDKHVTVELSKLRGGEKTSLPSVEHDIPYEKQKLLIENLNDVRKRFGADVYEKEDFNGR